ncbi:hypothetical protein AsAng_0002070 [Aureispira anguillae]|uniref:Uncharacterized protein n=1 Tax=Aureispira anguillae TaxID=2864201 RepID=A0A915VK69_9BACT|nr:hypothetical protein AsAng_0002070 [Aureispira anguillae]
MSISSVLLPYNRHKIRFLLFQFNKYWLLPPIQNTSNFIALNHKKQCKNRTFAANLQDSSPYNK